PVSPYKGRSTGPSGGSPSSRTRAGPTQSVHVPAQVSTPPENAFAPVASAAVSSHRGDEQRAWESLENGKSVEAIEGFLQQYPLGPHVQNAREELERRRWAQIDKTSIEALEEYLRTYPESTFRGEANQHLAALR